MKRLPDGHDTEMADDMTRLTKSVVIVLRLQRSDVLLEDEDTIAPRVRRRRATFRVCVGRGLCREGGLQIKKVCFVCAGQTLTFRQKELCAAGALTLNRLLWGLVSESGESLKEMCD